MKDPLEPIADARLFNKVFSALFYAVSSMLIVFANKIVLTTYSFPSVQLLAICQLALTLSVLYVSNKFGWIKLPAFSVSTVNKIMPLPLFYFGTLLFSLSGTKSLSLPMFVVLRRFSVLMTMYAEIYILKAHKSLPIQVCVYGMVIGALIAATADLAFDLHGYSYLMLTNIFGTANAITIKDKLTGSSLDEYGLLYYNSLFSIFPMIGLYVYNGDIFVLFETYQYWYSIGFWIFLVMSSIMGFLLNFSVMLCTKHNNPLTLTVFGCLKNIFVTYGGIFIGGDYIFSWTNFIGLTISTFSSVVYSFVAFKTPKHTANATNNSDQKISIVITENQQNMGTCNKP